MNACINSLSQNVTIKIWSVICNYQSSPDFYLVYFFLSFATATAKTNIEDIVPFPRETERLLSDTASNSSDNNEPFEDQTCLYGSSGLN
jgi:hypothetical protein